MYVASLLRIHLSFLFCNSNPTLLGTITHSGFEITEADEMYHTVWKNVDGLTEEVRLSPLFREGARVTKVLVEDFDTFEVGDALVEVEGHINT